MSRTETTFAKCSTLFLIAAGLAFCSVARAMECPSARINDVINNPIVISAMDTAWSNSQEGTQDEHIEGFNIYQCRNESAVDGNVYTTEIDWGDGKITSITYPSNRQSNTCRLVGNFHTHPGVGTSHPLSNDPYESDRPSQSEMKSELPGIIRFGLGPISGEGKTSDIFFGPEVSEKLSWFCKDVVVDSSDTGIGTAVAFAKPVSYSDPHLITHDGVAYRFHAVGEFVLAQSELGGFIVQARQRQTGPVSSHVSANSGFAFKVGNDEVAVALNVSNDLQVFVNKVEQAQLGDSVLPDGGQLSIAADSINVNWRDGSKAVVNVYANFLNLSLLVADVHSGKLSGLLGNFDNDNTNDMRTNLGVDISTTPQADQLYGIFADGWRVSDETSLFVYFDNEDTAFFTNRLFPGRRFTVDDLSDSARTSAMATCSNVGITNAMLLKNCIVDVGATSNVEFAAATMQVQNDLGDDVANIVDLVVQGRLEIPDVTCSDQSLVDTGGLAVADVSGVFIGKLTNPDLNKNWDAQFQIEQCGASVTGLFSLSSNDGLGFKRRFDGDWSEGRLSLNLAFPYSYTLDVGQAACIDMVALLAGDTNVLQGSWTSSNCKSGGVIDVVRE